MEGIGRSTCECKSCSELKYVISDHRCCWPTNLRYSYSELSFLRAWAKLLRPILALEFTLDECKAQAAAKSLSCSGTMPPDRQPGRRPISQPVSQPALRCKWLSRGSLVIKQLTQSAASAAHWGRLEEAARQPSAPEPPSGPRSARSRHEAAV